MQDPKRNTVVFRFYAHLIRQRPSYSSMWLFNICSAVCFHLFSSILNCFDSAPCVIFPKYMPYFDHSCKVWIFVKMIDSAECRTLKLTKAKLQDNKTKQKFCRHSENAEMMNYCKHTSWKTTAAKILSRTIHLISLSVVVMMICCTDEVRWQ